MNCVTNGNMSAFWWDFPPYVMDEQTGTDRGILATMLKNILRTCCNDVALLNYTRVKGYYDFDMVLHNVTSGSSSFVFMPYYKHSSHMTRLESQNSFFLPMVESPGAIYFFKKKASAMGSDLTAVILQGWPLLLLMLLGAAFSGIIIWLLVSN